MDVERQICEVVNVTGKRWVEEGRNEREMIKRMKEEREEGRGKKEVGVT